MKSEFLFLGTGGSTGTPTIGCKCDVCVSANGKNRRLRSSGLLNIQGKTFLIDVSPDIRGTSLAYGIDHLDGIFITHFHEDHVGGMNDLRPFFFLCDEKPIPIFMSENTFEVVSMRFSYLMNRFDIKILDGLRGKSSLHGVDFRYFTYSQQGVPVNGYRFHDFAYITDIKEYDKEIFEELKGIQHLVVSMLHERGTEMHFSLEEALNFASQAKATHTYLTHISHHLDHDRTSAKLPKNIQLAYDGLILDL